MTRRNKQKTSVRDRVPGLKKPRVNGAQSGKEVAVASQSTPEEVPPKGTPAEGASEKTEKRTPATTADYLAAQLHESQSNLMTARALNLKFRSELLAKDRAILTLEQKLHNQEVEKVEKLKGRLREEHKLRLGATLKKDDDTGEVYWLEKNSSEK